MSRQFNAEAIKKEIANLVADRDRINDTIRSLEDALRFIEGVEGRQNEFRFDPSKSSDITLLDAVKKICMQMIDGITRQRVTAAIEREFPFLEHAESSVSAALVNLAKGSQPMLKLALEGRGRTPAFYSTQDVITFTLTPEESKELMDPNITRGTGGWQSLWAALQKKFDKAKNQITLSAEVRARLYNYYHSYGVGGWQNRVKKVFARELNHLFAA